MSEVESAVLSCILVDDKYAHRALSLGLIPDHFRSMRMSTMYRTLQAMAANGDDLDLISFKDELDNRGLLEQIGGFDQVIRLDEFLPDTSHFEEYVDRVKAGGVRQRVADAGRKFAALPKDIESTNDILDLVTSEYEKVLALARGQGKVVTAEEAVNQLVTELEEPDWGSGVMTGYQSIDGILMGLRPKQLVVIAARPGMGKTALAVNMLVNFARANGIGAMFSLEMSAQELMVRIISEESGVPSAAMRANALTQHDWNALSKARRQVAKHKLFIEDSGSLTVDGIFSQAKELHRAEGIGLLVIDYLQLVDIPKRGSRNDEVAYASRRFKQLAMELDIPIILLSQLSRKVEGRPDKRPNLADLRDSGAIEQDADVVLFLYREGYYKQVDTTDGVTEIIIEKNRAGGTGTARLKWVPSTTSFVNP